jgi:hypothetical protein
VLILAILAAGALALPSVVVDTAADATSAPSTPPQQRTAGESFSYSLRAVMTQSIAGKDAFGKAINQSSAPTNVKGHESISITKQTADELTMHRLGSITAVVVGAKPVTKSGQGWTIVNTQGTIVRDTGKLGGLFLLPLPFLADGGVNAGGELKVGDRWSGQLGTKLYGMTSRPHLQYTVMSERAASGATIYAIEAVGSVSMKEPVMTSAGEPLGYATGTAHITAQLEYDRDNRRLISMKAELRNTLHYLGPTKHVAGSVKDHQQCEISLDLPAVAGGAHDGDGAGPASGPQE